MTKKELAQRHKDIDKELIQSYKVFSLRYKFQIVTATKRLGKILGITGQTIINYCKGGGSDGFLKEAILKQLKIETEGQK